RDDVELAIFKKYPNDARIRAAELQYAMTEQMYLTQVFNTETWKAVAEMNGRASICLSSASRAVLQKDATALREEVESLVFNTEARTEDLDAAFVYITSHGDQLGEPCDVAMSALDV
ncbi:MAG: hypothetical protein Q8P19_02965, partial [bacterium]|nr:hypothetical protein [bacterium]